MDLLRELKKIDIVSYLASRGLEGKRSGSKYIYSSPFSSDSEPSFFVYPNNSFYDFSNGIGGDIIDLVQKIENCSVKEALDHLSNGMLLPIASDFKQKTVDNTKFKNFNYKKFIAEDSEDIQKIVRYAWNRRIEREYIPSVSFYKDKETDNWMKALGLMFIHRDEDLDICGIKVRHIDNSLNRRFTGRGRLCFHVLENSNPNVEPTLYIMESETSANSLYEVLRKRNINFTILCVGGVSNYPERIPDKYSDIKDVRIIIDYDGGAKDQNGNEKYKRHMEIYEKFGSPIKINLKKGEDINTMYCTQQEEEIFKICYESENINRKQ